MKRSLRSWLWRVPIEQEVEEELALHAEMRRREGRPLDPDEMAHVRRTCVDIARRRERQMHLTQWLDERRTDARFALRQLRRAPGFALVAVLTLALGIGANSAVFALADATFLRDLPFTQPDDRLVMVSESRGPAASNKVAPGDYIDWRDQNTTLASIAAMDWTLPTMAGPDGAPEQVLAQMVTAGFFDVFGVTPLVGRTFQASDVTPSPQVVVVGERYWRDRLGADPAAIGRPIVINGRAHDLVGVVPASFQLVPAIDAARARGLAPVWTLFEPSAGSSRMSHTLFVFGRLKPGTSLEAAHAEVGAIASRLGELFPESNKGHGASVLPLREALIGRQVQLTSLLLLGVVGLVLLMCCANVASLLLAQVSRRTRELAVRAALGAGRGRVIAQLLTESLVLASIGGAVAVAVTAALLAAAPSLVPPGILPNAVTLAFDGRVAAVCAATALAVGILFGVAPAWEPARGRFAEAASEGRVTRRSGWLRSGLVSAQIAAAVLVLCGAGLFLRTLIVLQRTDSGARATEVLTGMLQLPLPVPGAPARYPTPDSVRRFYNAVEREVRAIPGVRSVAWGAAMPLDGVWFMSAFAIAGDPPKPLASRDVVNYQMVSPEYFSTLDVPVVAGRALTSADTGDAPRVGLVSEAFAARYLGGRNPIGTRLELSRMMFRPDPARPVESEPTMEIIGVVRQVKTSPDETQSTAHVYVPMAQNAWWRASLIVRPDGEDAAALAGPVRAAVARVDPERALARLRTIATIADDATARQRFRALLVGAFAALALMLAMVGVFGVLSQSVQQRMREFGVRIALGASRTNVIGLVVRHAARIAAIGLALGLGLAFMLGRLLASLIFPIAPSDPITYSLAPLVALLTAAVACVAPAWRATRVDPATAFRED
ncbi:MAG TPA: ABC transporter permease [Vicinamibacterales bacterium]|nr:ABC transporter permease [Vicinamibacterales bacterium]